MDFFIDDTISIYFILSERPYCCKNSNIDIKFTEVLKQWQKQHGGSTFSSFPLRRIRRCQDRIKNTVAHPLCVLTRISRGESNGTQP